MLVRTRRIETGASCRALVPAALIRAIQGPPLVSPRLVTTRHAPLVHTHEKMTDWAGWLGWLKLPFEVLAEMQAALRTQTGVTACTGRGQQTQPHSHLMHHRRPSKLSSHTASPPHHIDTFISFPSAKSAESQGTASGAALLSLSVSRGSI